MLLLDLNTASPQALAKLPGMTEKRIMTLVTYRSTTPIAKLWQLASLPGFGDATVRGLQEHVRPLADMMPRQLRCPLNVAGIPCRAPGEVVFMTWNVRRLSLGKPDFALAIIADVVRAGDIVALQEVVDVRSLGKLLSLLPKTWRCVASPPLGGAYTERYAFLWNDAVVRGLHTSTVVLQDKVQRPPFVVKFYCCNGGRTITCANFHAVCATGHKATQAECTAVRAHMDAFVGSDVDVLAGDFNSAYISWPGWSPALVSVQATTLAGTTLDQVWVRQGTGIRAGGVVKYHEYLDVRATVVATQAVSDHLPVYAVLAPKPVEKNRNAAPPAHPTCKDGMVLTPAWHVAAVDTQRYPEISSRLLTTPLGNV